MTVAEPKQLYFITVCVYGGFILLLCLPYVFSLLKDAFGYMRDPQKSVWAKLRRQMDEIYQKDLREVCPRTGPVLLTRIMLVMAAFGVLFLLKDAVLHPRLAELSYNMGRTSWWASLGDSLFAYGQGLEQRPVRYYTESTLFLAGGCAVALAHATLQHLKARRRRNKRIESIIPIVMDSKDALISSIKGYRFRVPTNRRPYTYMEIAEMLVSSTDVDLDIRIHLLDFYMSDIEELLPDGEEKEDILREMQPYWENLTYGLKPTNKK